MKRLSERTGNGHPGYHNISCGGGSSVSNTVGATDLVNHNNSAIEHFRRPRTANGGESADFLLDILHCAPHHDQQRTTNDAHSPYHRQGYQLLSAPASSLSTHYHHAYSHYNFPAFAAAAAAVGNPYSSHITTTSDAARGSFATSMGAFNFQTMFSHAGTYNPSMTISGPSADDTRSINLAASSSAALPCPATNDTFCASSSAVSKLQRGEKFSSEEGDHSNDNNGNDIVSVLHDATKKDTNGFKSKKPKLEPTSSEEGGGPVDDGDRVTPAAYDSTNSTSLVTASRVSRRSAGSGGRGSRGNGTHGCPYCPKKFSDAHEAELHQKTCVQQRPFDCTHCGRRFRQKTSLVQHLRIHTDTRPYQCRFCVRNFKQKSHLDQHERIHTGAKPYLCKYCNKAFRQKSGQASHELTHANAAVQQFHTKREESDDRLDGSEEDDDDGEDADEVEDEEDDTEQHNDSQQMDGELQHHSSVPVAGMLDFTFKSSLHD